MINQLNGAGEGADPAQSSLALGPRFNNQRAMASWPSNAPPGSVGPKQRALVQMVGDREQIGQAGGETQA